MSFIDRILVKNQNQLDPHLVGAAFWALHRGKITRAQMISHLDLQPDDEAELDLIITEHDSRSTQQRPLFALDVMSVPILIEAGELTTNAQVRSYLGL